MKNKLRHLTTATIACGAIAVVYLLAEPAVDRWRARRAGPRPAAMVGSARQALAPTLPVSPSGEGQLLSAIARLEQHESLSGRIHHQAHVAGLRLEGKGEYLQRGRGTRRHVKWSLESQHDGTRASLLQVTDGRFLWTDRHAATGRFIERVDLWQLRRQSQSLSNSFTSPTTVQTASAPFAPQLAASFGGLPMLLEALRAHFEFTPPGTFRAPAQLQLGDQPVLGMIGRWKPEALATLLGDDEQLQRLTSDPPQIEQWLTAELNAQPLSERVPVQVLVLFGRDDLFPYLIEYRSARDPLTAPERDPSSLFQLSGEPLARLRFFDVAFDRTLEKGEFIYEPPSEPEWLDGTSGYVRRLERLETIRLVQQGQRRLASRANAPER